METKEQEFEAGITIARVMRIETDNQGNSTGKAKEIKVGVVTFVGSHFVRIFNCDTGDVSPQTCEYYPIRGKNSWVEIIGSRKDKLNLTAASSI